MAVVPVCQVTNKMYKSFIRGLANSWSDLTNRCVNRVEPPCVMIREVLDVDEFGLTDILCMCTLVSDV